MRHVGERFNFRFFLKWAAALLIVMIGWGQACSRLEAPLSEGGTQSFSISQNGGGYGGLTSVPGYAYGPGTRDPELSDPNGGGPLPYIHYGQSGTCQNHPEVNGVINIDLGIQTYSPNLCQAPTQLTGTGLVVTAYNQAVGVYDQDIYVFKKSLNDSSHPSILCRTTQTEQGTEVGIDVLLYFDQKSVTAKIVGGKIVNGQPTQYTVAPFPVAQSANSNWLLFSGMSFNLAVRSDAKASIGTLNMVLDESQKNVSLSCWNNLGL